MLERNDERLLWQYVDGHTTIEENSYLQRQLKMDPQLRQTLQNIQMLDANLMDDELVPLPELLKIRILKKTKELRKIPVEETSVFDNKGMISFAAFNLLILVAAIIIYVFNGGWFNSPPKLPMLTDFNQFINTPVTHSFFFVCIAILGLLFLDSFLKNRNYGKMTTPV